MRTLLPAAVLGALALAPAMASAHVILTSHEARHGTADIKEGPCGITGSERGDVVHTFEAGETITLEWNEYIPHPGYYRIAFDDDGHDDFVDPASYDDLFTNDTVLEDNLFPHGRRDAEPFYTHTLTLPDAPCDNCTLQLVQMMTDKPPYEVGGNDLYYNCLDLVLVAPGGSGEDTGTAADVGDVGVEDSGARDTGSSFTDVGDLSTQPETGCATAARAPAGSLLVLVLGVLISHRRRTTRR